MIVWGRNQSHNLQFCALLEAPNKSFLVFLLVLVSCCFFIQISPLLAEEVVPQITRPIRDVDFKIDPFLFPGAVDLEEGTTLDIFFRLAKKPGELLEDRFRLHKERVAKRGDEPPLLEIFTGGDKRAGGQGFYAGGVTGPLDRHMNLNGVRLRAGYGRGFSDYTSRYYLGKHCCVEPHFKSQSDYFEGLIGYEFRFQKSIFKVYGGVLHEKRKFDKGHLEAQVKDFKDRVTDGTLSQAELDKKADVFIQNIKKDHQGSETGAKFLVEAWRDFENHSWFSGYASYSLASDFYAVHGRYGVPLYSNIDIGGEVSFYGNEHKDLMRAGLFTRVKDGDAEWMVSVGLDGEASHLDRSAFRDENVYVTLQYFQRLYLSELSQGLF